MKLDFLGRFERFETDFAHVLETLRVEGVAIGNRSKRKTSAAHHRDLIGPQEKTLIYYIYSADFERFDCPKTL